MSLPGDRDGGLYQVVYHLPQELRLRVGRLGEFDLPGGYYVYTGSAKRSLKARVERHQRPEKPKRWHVDYLAAVGRFVTAFTYSPSCGECALAAAVGGEIAIPRFGASDCRCHGHLSYFRGLPALPLPGGEAFGETSG